MCRHVCVLCLQAADVAATAALEEELRSARERGELLVKASLDQAKVRHSAWGP